MISYFKYSSLKIQTFCSKIGWRASKIRLSMLTASVYSINFLSLSELLFNRNDQILFESVAGGIILFVVISLIIRTTCFDQENAKMSTKMTTKLDVLFVSHIIISFFLYLMVVVKWLS